MDREQEMSAKIFVEVKEGPCTVLAWLPGNDTPIVKTRLSIKPGQYYAVKVPEFVPVTLSIVSTEIQNIINGEWMIVAFRDNDLGLRALSDGSSRGGSAWFWALAGHEYSGWLVPAAELGSLMSGRGAKGFELEKWTVAKGSEKGVKITVKVKNPKGGVTVIPNESKSQKEDASQ
jgi:hypothetical protein